ncbi:MAG: DUF362 domain-containing protein [Spirochaetes bacterium]|jgi:uncharacterized protein (DUF362 family)|nr:DUF362 domain-containing protein [Spirochaetota bacterium]
MDEHGLNRKDFRVMIKFCDEYNPEKMESIIMDGMKIFGYKPEGKIFVKPNVVYATKKGKYGSTAYTDPALVKASLSVLSKSVGVSRIDMGEKTAIGYPTRLTYKYSNYYKVTSEVNRQSKISVKAFCIDEEKRKSAFIGGKVHDNLRISEKMANADSYVYLPKLKCHCVSSMTGAVKLNIGIISDDERAIRHDFMLNDKIVDLIEAGYPDFIIMDAIDVGVGNEAVPTPRRLGLILMGINPLAVDIAAARLLGYNITDVPYLQRAVERGYKPAKLKELNLIGDIKTIKALDEHAKKILPYDDEFYRWQDIEKELKRLKSPIRFYWGPARSHDDMKCLTGCVMGIKMFFGFNERYAGSAAFSKARPAVLVVGKYDKEIDAKGSEVFLIGSCSEAKIKNAKKITRIDSCYATAVELTQVIRGRLGIPTPLYSPSQVLPLVGNMMIASFMKIINGRYLQDISHFLKKGLIKRI